MLAFAYPTRTTAEGRETVLALSPASGEVFSEFICNGGLAAIKVLGSVEGTISPLGVFSTALDVAFKQTSYVQEPSEYELESGGTVATGLDCSENNGAKKKCSLSTNAPVSVAPKAPYGYPEDVSIEGAETLPTIHTSKAGEFPFAFTTESEGGEGPIFNVEQGSTDHEVRCYPAASNGSFTNVKEGKVTLAFKYCKTQVAGINFKCHTGARVEEIVTKELNVLLAHAYPSEGGKTDVLVLSPASGETFAEFECSGGVSSIKVKGSVEGLLGPERAWNKLLNLSFMQSGYVQEPSEYELKSGGHQATGVSCTEKEVMHKCSLGGGGEGATAILPPSGEELRIEV